MPWQAQFCLLALIWGLSFYFIKLGNRSFDPLQVSFGRMLVGLAVLAVIVAVRRERLPRGVRAWWHILIVSALFNSIPMSLFAWAETRVSSIVASIWNGTTPLFMLLVVLLVFPDERPTRDRAAGLAVGFAGVVVVLGPWSGIDGDDLLGHLAAMGAAVCYGVGFPYMRRHVASIEATGIALSFGQILCAAVSLAFVAPFATSAPATYRLDAILAVCALGALGTGLAYVLQYAVLRAAGTTSASTVTYLIPVVATVAGIAFLGESMSWNEPVGALVVLGGVALSQGLLRYVPGRTRPSAAGSP
ncbi:MAG: DMT family transporter [bacterium]|nr:DMT family transporter [bacterium]